MTIKLLNITEVRQMIGCSRGHSYVLMKTSGFSKPIHLSKRQRAWRADEIQDWITARSAARDELQAA